MRKAARFRQLFIFMQAIQTVKNLSQKEHRELNYFSVVPLTDDGKEYLRELTSRLKGDKARYVISDSTGTDVVFSVAECEPMWEIKGISWKVVLTLFLWEINRHFTDEGHNSADFHRKDRYKGGEVALARQLLKELPESARDLSRYVYMIQVYALSF
jgi:hypothetical protein